MLGVDPITIEQAVSCATSVEGEGACPISVTLPSNADIRRYSWPQVAPFSLLPKKHAPWQRLQPSIAPQKRRWLAQNEQDDLPPNMPPPDNGTKKPKEKPPWMPWVEGKPPKAKQFRGKRKNRKQHKLFPVFKDSEYCALLVREKRYKKAYLVCRQILDQKRPRDFTAMLMLAHIYARTETVVEPAPKRIALTPKQKQRYKRRLKAYSAAKAELARHLQSKAEVRKDFTALADRDDALAQRLDTIDRRLATHVNAYRQAKKSERLTKKRWRKERRRWRQKSKKLRSIRYRIQRTERSLKRALRWEGRVREKGEDVGKRMDALKVASENDPDSRSIRRRYRAAQSSHRYQKKRLARAERKRRKIESKLKEQRARAQALTTPLRPMESRWQNADQAYKKSRAKSKQSYAQMRETRNERKAAWKILRRHRRQRAYRSYGRRIRPIDRKIRRARRNLALNPAPIDWSAELNLTPAQRKKRLQDKIRAYRTKARQQYMRTIDFHPLRIAPVHGRWKLAQKYEPVTIAREWYKRYLMRLGDIEVRKNRPKAAIRSYQRLCPPPSDNPKTMVPYRPACRKVTILTNRLLLQQAYRLLLPQVTPKKKTKGTKPPVGPKPAQKRDTPAKPKSEAQPTPKKQSLLGSSSQRSCAQITESPSHTAGKKKPLSPQEARLQRRKQQYGQALQYYRQVTDNACRMLKKERQIEKLVQQYKRVQQSAPQTTASQALATRLKKDLAVLSRRCGARSPTRGQPGGRLPKTTQEHYEAISMIGEADAKSEYVRSRLSLLRGYRLMQRRQSRKAMALFQGVLKRYPRDLSALLMVARLYTDSRSFRKARRTYNELLSYYPAEPHAYRGLGDLAIKRGDPKDAVTWYRLAVQNDPGNAQIWALLAKAAEDAGDDNVYRLARENYLGLTGNPLPRRSIRSKQRGSKAYRFSVVVQANGYFFHNGNIWNNLMLELGVRAWRGLWFMAGVEGRLRFLTQNQTDVSDIFVYGRVLWISQRFRGLYLTLQVGGSPYQAFAPQLFVSFDSGLPLGKYIQAHLGYRFFYFPNGVAHVLGPGLSLNISPLAFQLRYYLNIQEDERNTFIFRHAVQGTVRWQIRDWVSAFLSIGGGNALDFLLRGLRPPDSGPSAGSEPIREYVINARIGAQFQIARGHFLTPSYAYYREQVQFDPSDPGYLVQAHIINLTYRWLF